MKNSCFMQTAVRCAVCIPLVCGMLAGFSGCTAGDGTVSGGLTRYAAADISYTAEFPEAGTAECVRSGGTTVMRIVSPEHLCGITVTYDGMSCSLASGEMSVLLSPETASGLTGIFDLLAHPAEPGIGGIPSKSADGEETILTFDEGSVTLTADGVPSEVTFGERRVRIGNFKIQ